MKVSMNADWARFKAHGVRALGRPGFADWLEHAAAVVRAEAKREAANAKYLAQRGEHVRSVGEAAVGRFEPDRTT